jgi:hypothetical protein
LEGKQPPYQTARSFEKTGGQAMPHGRAGVCEDVKKPAFWQGVVIYPRHGRCKTVTSGQTFFWKKQARLARLLLGVSGGKCFP